MSVILPPTTWPENTEPTAEQWRDWFLSASDEGQIAIVQHQIDMWSTDSRCFMQDHGGQIVALTAVIERQRELLKRSKDMLGAILPFMPED